MAQVRIVSDTIAREGSMVELRRGAEPEGNPGPRPSAYPSTIGHAFPKWNRFMSVIESNEMADVLDRVKHWSAAERFALVREVLETLAPKKSPPSLPATRGRSVEEIVESFKTDEPAPDDETVRRWIDEQRMEKYG
jgi:hypothetical protein